MGTKWVHSPHCLWMPIYGGFKVWFPSMVFECRWQKEQKISQPSFGHTKVFGKFRCHVLFIVTSII